MFLFLSLRRLSPRGRRTVGLGLMATGLALVVASATLAAVGEWALAALWAAVAAGLALIVLGRPLCDAVRTWCGRWLGVPVVAPYRARPVVTRMVTGYWWNGYEYHKSEREARRQAWLLSRRDPQFKAGRPVRARRLL
jgi:hypothetical protein